MQYSSWPNALKTSPNMRLTIFNPAFLFLYKLFNLSHKNTGPFLCPLECIKKSESKKLFLDI